MQTWSRSKWLYGQLCEWRMNEWMNEWVSEWMNEWVNESANHSINHKDYLHNIHPSKVYSVPIFYSKAILSHVWRGIRSHMTPCGTYIFWERPWLATWVSGFEATPSIAIVNSVESCPQHTQNPRKAINVNKMGLFILTWGFIHKLEWERD